MSEEKKPYLTEAEEIINKIHTYLMSDEPSKRVLDLS